MGAGSSIKTSMDGRFAGCWIRPVCASGADGGSFGISDGGSFGISPAARPMFRVDHSRRHDRYWRVTMVCITGHTPSAFLAVSTRWSAHVADPFKTEHGGGPCRPEYPR